MSSAPCTSHSSRSRECVKHLPCIELTCRAICLVPGLLQPKEKNKKDKKDKDDVIQIHKPKQRTGGKKKFSCSIL